MCNCWRSEDRDDEEKLERGKVVETDGSQREQINEECRRAGREEAGMREKRKAGSVRWCGREGGRQGGLSLTVEENNKGVLEGDKRLYVNVLK